MKTPPWWRRKGVVSTALLPASCLYRALHRARLRGMEEKALPVPVICVGNATAGGAGKTPTVMALMDWLNAHGVMAQCISRGYGGSLYGPVRVDPTIHSANEVGDEPLLIAEHGPCWVGKRRLSAATAAVLDGARCIVMDDGLQNPTVKKDLSLLVIDGGFGFGNGRILPAGPLRESVTEAAAKAQAAVLIGEDKTGALAALPPGLPVLHARLTPEPEALAWLRGKKYLAFAGIGRPEKFFSTLRDIGVELAEKKSFADHHPFTQVQLRDLMRRAAQLGAGLITTRKDYLRIPEAWRDGIDVLPVHLVFEDTALLASLCAPLLAKATLPE